jgi:type IV secretory pathway TrbL component
MTNDCNALAPMLGSRALAVSVLLMAVMVLGGAGCSRLSGGHQSDEDEAQSAKMERLLADAPESLKARRATAKRENHSAADAFGPRDDAAASDASSDIVEGHRPAAATPTNRSMNRTADVASTAAEAAKNSVRSRRKTPQTYSSRPNRADDIPDASEIGL